MKTIVLELTQEEITVLRNLLDGAVRYHGIEAAKAVAHFHDKIAAAVAKANEPAPANDQAEAA
jgi:hypothetical protein